MKRSGELRRRTPLARGAGPARGKAPRRSQPDRDWTLARQKVEREGRCRVCGRTAQETKLDAAHVIGREYDARQEYESPDAPIIVDPADVVPLCHDVCHLAYDARRLDLLPVLTLAEQARAVLHVGIARALRRIGGER